MEGGRRTLTRTSRNAGIILVAGLAGLVAWFALGRERAAPEDAESVEPAEESTPEPPPQPPATPAPSAQRDEAPAADAPVARPITPDQERVRRENEILGIVSDALDLGDAGKLRMMAKTYREQNFEGADKIANGYEIIAACLDHPGPISRAPAKYYDDYNRGSILLPYLRRACFHGPE
jgi:type IV secretory pathway VirB10-like protein